MTSRTPENYLLDILGELEKLERLSGRFERMEEFEKDWVSVYACMRAFEIIGEATKHVPADIKSKDEGLKWKEMAGMRDYLIHAYSGVEIATLWKTLKNDVLPAKVKITELLEELKKQVENEES